MMMAFLLCVSPRASQELPLSPSTGWVESPLPSDHLLFVIFGCLRPTRRRNACFVSRREKNIGDGGAECSSHDAKEVRGRDQDCKSLLYISMYIIYYLLFYLLSFLTFLLSLCCPKAWQITNMENLHSLEFTQYTVPDDVAWYGSPLAQGSGKVELQSGTRDGGWKLCN